MENLKRKRGITLIALVITIIVLLILAGVSLNLIAGESGILNRATTSASKTNQAQIQEEIGLAYNAIMVEGLPEGWDNSQKAKALEKELEEKDPKTAVIPLEEMLIVSYKGYEATIDSRGKISIEDTSKGEKPSAEVTILTTGEGVEKVEIQVIAQVSEGTIEGIEALNGAVLKTENSKENQIYEVSENGKFYFRIKASNGRTAIVASEEITNILQVSESLLEGISKINSSGIKQVKVNGTTAEGEQDEVTYSLNVVRYVGDLVLDGNTTVEGILVANLENGASVYVLGNASDVATENEYAKNTVVLKVEGNLTISEGVYLTAKTSGEGYGGPKGMIVYCTGTLTNNGTITATACGAKAEGENVYLWKNGENDYEYVPAVGATGGISPGNMDAYDGENGIQRQSGGGGAGGYGGTGSSGTSYSGGTGGGGSYNGTGENGVANGGKGGKAGNARHSGCFTSGGAGNPGGFGFSSNWSNGRYTPGNGKNGTGGLLILYGNKIINNHEIVSYGSSGGVASASCEAGGGSSGGGSINLFYKESCETGSITTTGGPKTPGNDYGSKYGGAGGTGSISVGSISSGAYESIYTNY